jgi:hypothetical protein
MKYIDLLVLAFMLVLALSGCAPDNGVLDVPVAGPQGAAGLQGPQGAVGPQGPQGLQGAAGLNGTTITVVQFCPGVTPVYPSTFPETGLCINGTIYAVYSANDGFLTSLPNGVYDSNAIGSSCTFTVSGCTITPN